VGHQGFVSPGIFGSLEGDFRAVAATIVPEASSLDEAGWIALEGVIDQTLTARDAATRRQVLLFVRVLGWISRARFGRGLASLDARRRERLLAAVERSRLLLLRRGFWGLRSLVFLGYWTREEAAAAIGYRALPDGWGVRR
jgi:hypothetical protein